MDFSKTVVVNGGDLHITVAGYLNEFADLGQHNFKNVKNLFIDFAQITMLNSRGVMTWFAWFGQALQQNNDLNIVFLRCPVFLVNYFNSVGLMPKRAKVQSFAAPMYCIKCCATTNYMLVENQDYSFNPTARKYEVKTPLSECEKCKLPMEPDYNPEKYFEFLK